MLLLIVRLIVTSHFEEALLLIERIIQFSKSIAQFKTSRVRFKTFHSQRISGDRFCQRRNIAWIVIEKHWLYKSRLQKFGEQEIDQFAARCLWVWRFVWVLCSNCSKQRFGCLMFININS